MSETVIIAIVSTLGGTSFGGIILALFQRRKTQADTELTVGKAWQEFVASQTSEWANVRKDNDQLRGEVNALRNSVDKLTRRENDNLYWQARMVQREEIVQALLESKGITVPPMPEPPAGRAWMTRAEDRGVSPTGGAHDLHAG